MHVFFLNIAIGYENIFYNKIVNSHKYIFGKNFTGGLVDEVIIEYIMDMMEYCPSLHYIWHEFMSAKYSVNKGNVPSDPLYFVFILWQCLILAPQAYTIIYTIKLLL